MQLGLFVSGFVNRFGCRPVAIVGSIVAAISLGVSTFVPNVYVLILTYGTISKRFEAVIIDMGIYANTYLVFFAHSRRLLRSHLSAVHRFRGLLLHQ